MAQAQFLSPQQIDRLPSSPADRRIHYGSEPFQFGDLRLPQAPGSHPVAVVIHGGCWKYRHGDLTADLQNTAALASALTHHGIATWNIEYRQIDIPGGGWTGTFEDVANAIDYLRVLAKRKIGDDVTFTPVENTSHFELIAPGSEAGDLVENAVLSMLKLKNKESEKIGVQK